MGNRIWNRRIHALSIALLILFALSCADTRNRVALYFEETDIRKAAERYLNAEVHRDLRGAFACLAPSSTYRAAHSYENYLREAEGSPLRITGYRIIDISKLRDNHDRSKYPRIEKFVQVEVDVTFCGTNQNESVPVNFSFTFIKEGGAWFKG